MFFLLCLLDDPYPYPYPEHTIKSISVKNSVADPEPFRASRILLSEIHTDPDPTPDSSINKPK
jgi:hypothetical protein